MSGMLALASEWRGESFPIIASETSTAPRESILNSATAGSGTTSKTWRRSAVTIVVELPKSDAPEIPLRKLLEIVKSALKISDRTADISSLNVENARITRDSKGHLRIELVWPQPESASDPDHVSLELRISTARSSAKKARSGTHSRLARELRALTGLPASALAMAFGVTREQYQRWVSGRPISDVRHGQLIYAHTIAAEVARKLGSDQAPVWWRTQLSSGETPEQLLRRRNLALVYESVVSLPDPRPVVDDVELGLRPRDDGWSEEPPEGIEAQDDWSPYRPHRDDEE